MRLIDADKLKQNVLDWEDCYNGFSDTYDKARIIDEIEEQPTIDAVEVVRCKDCRWFDKTEDSSYGYCHAMKHAYLSKNWEISIYRTYKADFYCADGEKNDETY